MPEVIDAEEVPELPTCSQCGEVHVTKDGKPSCPAHITSGERKGRPCRHEMGWNTSHVGTACCSKHGGSTPSHVKKAVREAIETEARKQLGLEGWQPVHDPYTALADLAGEILALKDKMREKVEELETLRSYGGEFGEQIDILFSAYERGVDRAEKILTSMARLDLTAQIAKLQAALDAETARIVERALTGAAKAAGLDSDQRSALMAEFGKLLRVQESPAELGA